MRLFTASSCLCSSVLSWVTLLVFECLMIQSFKVLSLILKLRGAFSDALLRVGLTCLPVVVDSLKAILLQCSVWVFPASCGTLPSLSRLRLATSHLFNLLVLVGGYLDRAYLLPVPESHCPPKDYSSSGAGSAPRCRPCATRRAWRTLAKCLSFVPRQTSTICSIASRMRFCCL